MALDSGYFEESKAVMTNADRINEELAAILEAFCNVSECRRAENGAVCPFYANCPNDTFRGNWPDWLQLPCGGAE